MAPSKPVTWRGRRRRNAPRRRYARKTKMTSNITRNPLVRADRLLVRLPWQSNYVFATNTNGLVAFKRFRLNSLWDPDYATGSDQTSVMGYNLYNAIYKKYRVYGAQVEFTIDNGTTGVSVPCAMCPSTYPFQGADTIPQIATQPRSTRFLLGNGSGSGSRYTKRVYIKIPQIMGQTSAAYRGDDSNWGLLDGGSNPLNDCILTMGFGSTPSAAGITLSIRIIYHVELFDPEPLATSLAADPHAE